MRAIGRTMQAMLGVFLFWVGILCCLTIALIPIGLPLIGAAVLIGGAPVSRWLDELEQRGRSVCPVGYGRRRS